MHSHNLKPTSATNGIRLRPSGVERKTVDCKRTFNGFVRKFSLVGIRNDVWIVNTSAG